LKWTTIESADTAPMAISARQRLRQKKSLNDVSTVGGQDHDPVLELEDVAMEVHTLAA
jgi:hypothetical protein